MKLHEVLSDALRYLEMAEKDPNIWIDMRTWFDWLDVDKTQCSVCLAGAYFCKGVINPELAFDSSAIEAEEGEEYSHALGALNALRQGCIEDALDILGITATGQVPTFTVYKYTDDSAGFRRDMREILDYLKSNDY